MCLWNSESQKCGGCCSHYAGSAGRPDRPSFHPQISQTGVFGAHEPYSYPLFPSQPSSSPFRCPPCRPPNHSLCPRRPSRHPSLPPSADRAPRASLCPFSFSRDRLSGPLLSQTPWRSLALPMVLSSIRTLVRTLPFPRRISPVSLVLAASPFPSLNPWLPKSPCSSGAPRQGSAAPLLCPSHRGPRPFSVPPTSGPSPSAPPTSGPGPLCPSHHWASAALPLAPYEPR